MWVLIYLCLTRKGPGGVRRDEFAFGAILDDTNTRLHKVMYAFFDTEDQTILSNSKSWLFHSPVDMEEWILPQFHPYFEELKPLVSDWWKILHRSYLFSEFMTIHAHFLDAIKKAIATLPPQDPDPEGIAQELERRHVNLQQLLPSANGLGILGPSSNDVPPWAVSPDRMTKGTSSCQGERAILKEPPSSPSPININIPV